MHFRKGLRADEIGRDCNQGDKYALISDCKAHTVCEDAVFAVSGRTAHNVAFCGFHTERKSREAIRDEIYPKQMRGLKYGEPGKRRDENGQHFRKIGRQQELNGFADIVINTSSLAHCRNDCREVVVGEYHIRDVLCDVGARDAHTHADVGVFD